MGNHNKNHAAEQVDMAEETKAVDVKIEAYRAAAKELSELKNKNGAIAHCVNGVICRAIPRAFAQADFKHSEDGSFTLDAKGSKTHLGLTISPAKEPGKYTGSITRDGKTFALSGRGAWKIARWITGASKGGRVAANAEAKEALFA